MIISRDIQEIVANLSSDKAKAREEGIKLLNTCLEGERSIAFCKYLGASTAKLKLDEIPHSETWLFLISLLIQCVSSEIASSKRKLPKVSYAKTLRIVIQRAEDTSFSGKELPLLPVVKSLYSHICDVLSNVPSFQSEYGVILRHLLAVRDYRFLMRKRVYSSLVLLYLDKVEVNLGGKSSNSKEEAFRCILTFQSLLENPPGDYPDDIRENIVDGFVRIFRFVREEGKVSRKLIECINIYLLKDGPNLDCLLVKIHEAVQHFVFRSWSMTHDRSLKDALILYARLQLNLTRGGDEGNLLVEQFLDAVCKELDQSCLSNSVVPRREATKEDKFESLSVSQRGFVELAALVFYRACKGKKKAPSRDKRVKIDAADLLLKEALMHGKWLWNAMLCCLIRKYRTCISKDLIVYWFEGISSSLERIITDANREHAYEGLLWTLRSLKELSSTLLGSDFPEEMFSKSNELNNAWQVVWTCLLHGLPIFSNVATVVDASLVLLGSIVSTDLMSMCVVPQDVWDLKLFKQMPTASVLYFIACYFSHKSSQGGTQDSLHLRKDLLRAVLAYVNLKESSMLDEHIVQLLPAAAYALCTGCIPLQHSYGKDPLSCSIDISVSTVDLAMTDEQELEKCSELFECSAEDLAKVNVQSSAEVTSSYYTKIVRLPQQLRGPLLHEMQNCIFGALAAESTEKKPLLNVFFLCGMLSNFIYGLLVTRKQDEVSLFVSKVSQYLLELLDRAIKIIEGNNEDFQALVCSSCSPDFNLKPSLQASITSFLCCHIFVKKENTKFLDSIPYPAIVESMGRLLNALARLYEQFSETSDSEHMSLDSSSGAHVQISATTESSRSRLMDVDLDVNESSKEMDVLSVGGTIASGSSFSAVKWKIGLISLISGFFSVVDVSPQNILFELMGKESDRMVREKIIYCLCQHLHCSSAKVVDLVKVLSNMVDVQVRDKLDCGNIVVLARKLLGSFLSQDSARENDGITCREGHDMSLTQLAEVVNRVAEFGLLNWCARVKLIDCVCSFVSLVPHIGQTMIERLFLMLQDPDYRVRFSLAQHIGVLFQTWDGHEELFQDICSNFGVMVVLHSKGKLVTADEVLAAGSQPRLVMETVIITLMHLAFHSEKIELEVVFMICVIPAVEPCHRELVNIVLDNLATQLHYTTRCKYLEQLMGQIIFCWIACNVSLVSLVKVRELFLSDAEPSQFLQYSCNWLLPALLLEGDATKLNWVAQVTCQPLAVLVRNHFVPIFSVCMALHCSRRSGWERGALVLQKSILLLAEMTEIERDKLIKKHMVSTVGHMLFLASCLSDPPMPSFPKNTVACAIQTVVDGFFEMEDLPATVHIVDKVNIFRPDRVFALIREMHYKICAAAHHRHKCHCLAGIEVLVEVLGHRAVVPSTSNYLFNLIGQFVECAALQDQCSNVVSLLLETSKSSPNLEFVKVLGEQLQYLVSKLVSCCIPSESTTRSSVSKSAQFLSLLHQLIVESDPTLHDYVRELEPFPEIDIFDEIRVFHKDLCVAYSPRDHLLKFMRRSCYLPPRLLLSSIQALHRKLLLCSEASTKDTVVHTSWHSDPDIMRAVWTLVHICGSSGANSIRPLVADFLSKVGIGDPYSVVFHLPGDARHLKLYPSANDDYRPENGSYMDTGLSNELLVALLKLLMKYLMDDSVRIVDMASQALRGILSTERGQKAILSFDSYERSLIGIHSKGINVEQVEKVLLDLERKFKAEATPLEKSSLWSTHNKSFETWICPLLYSLIGHTADVVLRLCQDIVFLKAEIAELLLPFVISDLAGRKDLDLDTRKLLSMQVQEHILTESNTLIKSIQVILVALNELRIQHVRERSTEIPLKRENSKHAKPSSNGSKAHSTSGRTRGSISTPGSIIMLTTSWDKVYWLSIDYLVVAKSAINCGSYFTALMYVEYWCGENFNSLTLGSLDFSHLEVPDHIEILASAVTQINEPDSLYGIIKSHKLTSQVVTFEHEGNWSKALECYDLLVRSSTMPRMDGGSIHPMGHNQPAAHMQLSAPEEELKQWKSCKGLIRSLQQMGCTHVLDVYCQGLTSRNSHFLHDQEFVELQYEAAWRAGNWDFSVLPYGSNDFSSLQHVRNNHFNEDLHSCLRALQEGELHEFQRRLRSSKQELVHSVSSTSEESTEYIYSTIVKLQILYHLSMSWNLRWGIFPNEEEEECSRTMLKHFTDPIFPTMQQLSWLNQEWNRILVQTQLNMNLLEPFITFRQVLLKILSCNDCTKQHLLQSASTLRKGSRFSQAAASLHEFKIFYVGPGERSSSLYWLGRLEEAKLLRAQGQAEMAISLAKNLAQNCNSNEESSGIYRLVGKWLAETRSSNSRTILENYLKPAVALAESYKPVDKKFLDRKCQAHFNLAHYADALFRSFEERLNSSEWQAAMRLRKHKTMELEALIRRLKSSTKGEKTEYTVKIQELQKQLAMDKEEAEKLKDDTDNFLNLALEGYKRCLVIADKYDVRVVFRLVSMWFGLSFRQKVVNNMLSTVDEVQSYKFVPLVYQIASRMGSSKDNAGPCNFQFALVSLVKKMAIDHPYHTIFQLLALANGDRIKDKQQSRNSFVVDMDKILAAKNLLKEVMSYHGEIITQTRQMVEIYIKLAELETRREDTNKKMPLPRDIRSVRELELVPVVTATFPVDRGCHYHEGSFPHFKGLTDSVMIMNGINAPKVVECLGSDGKKYRQLAKSGNDDLRQDAVMEQFFGLVNTFLQNNRDTRKRRLGIRTYKVVPFTPSAGVLEWVNGTFPLGEYLIGSTRNGGAHGRYGMGDWSFMKCREHMSNAKDKRRAFEEVCENFRPVMHHFFLERFLQPADWFEKRLAYTRSVAASSMVGYIVGLGDRHAMNILIDQTTAEVVHIDLGVAFEQGLMLKTPERVPFRLTRDIIDGMGVTGVEGVFRRCCEETLSVMRTNKEALLTIVEVFIHDPLYKWALSPLKALQRQKETDDDLVTDLGGSEDEYEGNKDAARALMRVKQKLDGYEEGELRSLNGQVQQLIQDAIDPERLCHLFPGWGAWL